MGGKKKYKSVAKIIVKIAKKNVLKFVFGLQKNLLYDIINIYYKYYMKIQCSQRKGDIDMAVLKVTKENFENEKTQTSDSWGGLFRPVSGSADIFPVFRRRNGAQPRREGRIFLQPDPF